MNRITFILLVLLIVLPIGAMMVKNDVDIKTASAQEHRSLNEQRFTERLVKAEERQAVALEGILKVLKKRCR